MVCQNCGKNEANTHIKQVINGDMAEVHLCKECASHLGYGDMMSSFDFGFGGLFSGLLNDVISVPVIGNTVRCEKCGCTFDNIVREGRVGCSECYKTFYDRLLPSIQKIHGKSRHSGKISKGESVPAPALHIESREEKIQKLKARMNEAAADQDFEQAAALRDEIKLLEQGGSL